MDERRIEAEHLIEDLNRLAPDSLERVAAESQLVKPDRRTIELAARALPGTTGALVIRLLADWDVLSPAERIAGLLAIARSFEDAERG